jgi:hypothetical protein
MITTQTTTSCLDCSAPMAADQRYCLNCGQRRGAPRVAFPPPAPAELEAAAAPRLPPAPPSVLRPGATGVWVTAVGVLLLAMGVGVLIGRSGTGASARPVRAAAPITVTVPSAGAGAAATATATPAPAAKQGGKHKSAKTTSASAGKADSQKIQQLNNLAPSDYAKKSKALPKTVGTTGKAPPKDNKPAGGGSGFQAIG